MTCSSFFHNSRDGFYRFPSGAVTCGRDIVIRFKISGPYLNVEHVVLRLWNDGWGEEQIKMDVMEGSAGDRVYQADVTAPEAPGLLWYYFIINCPDKVCYYGNSRDKLGGIGDVYENSPHSYQVTVYREGFKTPSWFKDAIMYQIMVDRFYNGNDDGSVGCSRGDIIVHKSWDDTPNYKYAKDDQKLVNRDFFGGNLRGVLKKLPYLKELGISAIYLNPIFESPSNHKYDTGDYMKIDPMFGNEDILRELADSANDMGIFIILDGVFSHTGSDSVYFNSEGNYDTVGAYQSVSSPYYRWYTFRHHPYDYACWWGIKTLPEVNELEPSYMEFMLRGEDSVVRHWMRLGIKGWRLDVADELPDEFIKCLRETVKAEDDDAVVIGEVWEDASNKVSYGKLKQYFCGDELDSVMNYALKDGLLDFILGKCTGEHFNRVVMSHNENYPLHAFYSLMNILGTHDTPRIKYVLSGVELDRNLQETEAAICLTAEQQDIARERMYMASAFLMAFPGVPCIYYGDEAGLGGGHDPLNRRTYPWGKEDNELIKWYRTICRMRVNIDALRTGAFETVHYGRDTFGFVRYIMDGTDVFDQKREDGFVLVLLNRDMDNCHDVLVDLRRWNIHSLSGILGGCEKLVSKDGCFSINIPPLKCLVLVYKE